MSKCFPPREAPWSKKLTAQEPCASRSHRTSSTGDRKGAADAQQSQGILQRIPQGGQPGTCLTAFQRLRQENVSATQTPRHRRTPGRRRELRSQPGSNRLNESHKSHSLPAREIRGMRGCWKPRCRSGVRKAGLAVPEIPRACADRSGMSLGRSRREAPLVPRPVAMAQMCPGTPISVSWWAQHPPGFLPGSRGAKWGLGEVGRAPQEGPALPGPQRSAGEGIAPEELRGSKVWGLWW